MEGQSVTVRTLRPGAPRPEVIREWHHPGCAALSLEALCIEVNARKTAGFWKMPVTIGEVVAKLAAIGRTLPQVSNVLATAVPFLGRFVVSRALSLTRLGRLQLAAARRAHVGTACCASPRG